MKLDGAALDEQVMPVRGSGVQKQSMYPGDHHAELSSHCSGLPKGKVVFSSFIEVLREICQPQHHSCSARWPVMIDGIATQNHTSAVPCSSAPNIKIGQDPPALFARCVWNISIHRCKREFLYS